MKLSPKTFLENVLKPLSKSNSVITLKSYLNIPSIDFESYIEGTYEKPKNEVEFTKEVIKLAKEENLSISLEDFGQRHPSIDDFISPKVVDGQLTLDL